MRNIFFFFVLLVPLSKNNLMAQDTNNLNTFYNFEVADLYGGIFHFENLKGKKVIIVNTASECVRTPQYAEMQKLYDTYKDQNLVIIGFPSDDFNQEKGSKGEIAIFCEQNYGVTFPMMDKVSVRGEYIHPVYLYLTKKELNGVLNSEVISNFQKYLVNEDGSIYQVINPREPISLTEEVVNWISKE